MKDIYLQTAKEELRWYKDNRNLINEDNYNKQTTYLKGLIKQLGVLEGK